MNCIEEVKQAVWHDKGKGLRENEAVWLIEFCCSLKPQVVLDIGTGWGVTGRIFSLTSKKVYTIDKMVCGYARQAIAKYARNNVAFIQSPSADALLPIQPHVADLAFIDAGHPTLYVIADFLKFSRYVKDGGVICFHDCDRRDVVHALNMIEEKMEPKLYEGYKLTEFHRVGITRAYYWEKQDKFRGVDINRVDPAKAKK